MKKNYAFIVFLFSNIAISQTAITEHIVSKNETLYSLSRKYEVLVTKILEQNPQIKNHDLITEGSIIKIPVSNFNTINSSVISNQTSDNYIIHTVIAGETKFGLHRKYGVSISELEKDNPHIVTNLQIGHQLKIRQTTQNKNYKTHIVKSGETLFSLAKLYEVELSDLSKINNTNQKIIIGQELIIPSSSENYITESEKYLVKSGDTKFSLSKKFNISISELENKNPNIKQMLKTGEYIYIPVKSEVVESININKTTTPEIIETNAVKLVESVNENKITVSDKNIDIKSDEIIDLSKSINKNQTKNIVFLFPFNPEEVETKSDTYTEFYKGSQIAIKKLKEIGVEVNQVFLNSTNTEQVNFYLNNNASDIIIGDFKPEFNTRQTPVVYPFNKNVFTDNSIVYSTSKEVAATKTLLEYINSQNGNIVVVNDIQNASDKELISSFSTTAKFVTLKNKSNTDLDNLTELLTRDKKNFVVLNTTNSELFLSTTTHLLNNLYLYDIQLAVLKPVPNQVNLMRARLLNTLYVSSINEEIKVNTQINSDFNYPNQSEQIKGFDVTYDSVLRSYQTLGFQGSAEKQSSKQIINTFNYKKTNSNNYINNEPTILFYNNETDTNKIF